MKKQTIAAALILSTMLPALAGIDYSVGNVNGSGTSLGAVIPDANLSGFSSTITVSGANWSLSTVTVTLNLSGGYNGDLYAYLSFNGTSTMLLNRVGTGIGGGPIQNSFGFSTAGFNNVTLSDLGTSGNIHNVQNPTSGSGIAYTTDGGSLATFNTMNPNGNWTLFLADRSGGNVTTLEGWSLNIEAVPEPANVAMGIFGGIVGLGSLLRWRFKTKTETLKA